MSNADSKYVWMEGSLVPYEDAKVPILSHTLHYGTGAFEGIRAYKQARGGTAIFRAHDHFVRLVDSARALGCKTGYTPEQYVEAARETIKANGFEECYIRPLVYLDDSARGLKLPSNPRMLSAIAVWPWGKYMGDEGVSRGIRVMTSTYRRADVSTGLPYAKLTGGYVTSVLARREAAANGLDEAILLDAQGLVAEGSGENLFLVKDGHLFTPPPFAILPGLTRDSVIQLARHLGLPVTEAPLIRNQLYLADELFFTGTAAEVTPIREVDHRVIGKVQPGPISKRLNDLFLKVIRGEASEFRHWLTSV